MFSLPEPTCCIACLYYQVGKQIVLPLRHFANNRLAQFHRIFPSMDTTLMPLSDKCHQIWTTEIWIAPSITVCIKKKRNQEENATKRMHAQEFSIREYILIVTWLIISYNNHIIYCNFMQTQQPRRTIFLQEISFSRFTSFIKEPAPVSYQRLWEWNSTIVFMHEFLPR